MSYFAGEYDVAVIGAGHAGIEAALAAARLGLNTVLFTINLDWVGNIRRALYLPFRLSRILWMVIQWVKWTL